MAEPINKIKATIIVVTYNCADVIEENIQSCIKEESVEIIIVDNNSTDDTVKKIQPYISDHLTLIKNKKNTGFTAANNMGISLAKGAYILFLNPDASLQPGSLPALIDFLDGNKKAGAVAPTLQYPDNSLQNYTRRFPTPWALWVESFIPRKWWNKFRSYRKYTYQDKKFLTAEIVEQPAGAALLFRNQWLLDESYFNYVSDVDLCKTIIDDGYQIIQLPQIRVTHYQSKGGTDNKEIRTILDLDNYSGMLYYFKKNHQYYYRNLYYILFLSSLFFRWSIALFQGKAQSKARWFKLKHFIFNTDIKTLYDK